MKATKNGIHMTGADGIKRRQVTVILPLHAYEQYADIAETHMISVTSVLRQRLMAADPGIWNSKPKRAPGRPRKEG